MELLAYLITQAIVLTVDLLVLLHMPPLPEGIEITLLDVAYKLVETFHLPIYLGFSQ